MMRDDLTANDIASGHWAPSGKDLQPIATYRDANGRLTLCACEPNYLGGGTVAACCSIRDGRHVARFYHMTPAEWTETMRGSKEWRPFYRTRPVGAQAVDGLGKRQAADRFGGFVACFAWRRRPDASKPAGLGAPCVP